MDRILQYQKLTNIKPEYHQLRTPYYQTSRYRFRYNIKEISLWYSEELGIFIDEDRKNRRDQKNQTGNKEKKKKSYKGNNYKGKNRKKGGENEDEEKNEEEEEKKGGDYKEEEEKKEEEKKEEDKDENVEKNGKILYLIY